MKYLYASFYIFFSTGLSVFADSWVLGDFQGAESEQKIRTGDIHTEDIPNILVNAINFFMGIAGTIAVIFIIIGAYKILFGSLEQDKTKGRDTILMALGGFAIASLAWFIVKFLLNNLS